MPVCPDYLENGVCTVNGCPHNHTLRICRPCRIWCSNETSYQQHLRGKRHAAVLKDGLFQVPSFCEVCYSSLRFVRSRTEYDAHIASRKHQTAVAVRRQQGEHTDNVQATPDAHCDICGVDIFERDRGLHERSEAHRKKERFAVYRAAFDEAERDKAGVSVETKSEFPFLDAPSDVRGSVASRLVLAISFSSTDTAVYLTTARMSSSMSTRTEKQ